MDRARFADRRAHEVVDVRRGTDALEAISRDGFWAVVATFEGDVTAIRFAVVEQDEPAQPDEPDELVGDGGPRWTPLDGRWTSSLDRTAYVSAVAEVRERIAAGFVYQVNVCRVLTHELSDAADLDGLDLLVRQGNPAPHGARIRCDEAGIDLVCASPELYLRRRDGRLVTRPIKGTAPTPELMLPKDHAENVMIVDLMRNDISGVCEPGTVSVDELCVTEAHPGLVHLVSTVSGALRPGVEWPAIFGATFPPGSVSGAPKSSALTTIGALEPSARGPYCGAVGWVDADRGTAELAVGIRTFWADRDDAGRRHLRFGTGAGITWHSDPEGEWRETELKAARLIGLAAGTVTP
ncbi:para-aminobenzoate synthetase component 1 [Humibacillus xanthopallidus]|uniref:Para-aminobenzoate synthetase component 1 n=1 Tax=Humibacillus xanthopallidus TaxID=412689 RepID=A0A543PUL8_9MICO|nr:chorismate-binding protein [Humibacillus xanthopallidus]TQN47763.1 para-aminobenzoate synthetase component 1 [Humibacillus xanthopallidus]